MQEIKHDRSTLAWNAMGDEWFRLAQSGESRNCFIMPNMLKFIGDVKGQKVLDLGCGEGGYSRELAKRGAQLVSVDCSGQKPLHMRPLLQMKKIFALSTLSETATICLI